MAFQISMVEREKRLHLRGDNTWLRPSLGCIPYTLQKDKKEIEKNITFLKGQMQQCYLIHRKLFLIKKKRKRENENLSLLNCLYKLEYNVSCKEKIDVPKKYFQGRMHLN